VRKFLLKLPEGYQAQFFYSIRLVNKPERRAWNPVSTGFVISIRIHALNIFKKINVMIRKLKSGQYRIYSRKIDPRTKRRRNLGTFDSLEAARQHEKAIQYFKHH
jgi:hypothetical protein